MSDKDKDFLKVFNFAFDRGFRKTEHTFGPLMQKGCIGINMEGIFVWTPIPKEGTHDIVCKWVKVAEYKGNNSEEIIKKIKELDK